MRSSALLRHLVFACMAAALPALAQDPAPKPALPSLAELEAAGALIGAIEVQTHNIFDTEDPREDNLAYRAANRLHAKTRPWLIRSLLLFRSGERLSVRLVEETERLIRANSTVYEVWIRPLRYADGVVDLEVRTRDTWTLQPGLKLRRAGGRNTGAFTLKETNFAGTGTTVGLERSSAVDREGTSLQLSHDHLFDGWTAVKLERASYDDGSSAAASIKRPFYALDTRRAAGISASRFDRVDKLYVGGVVAGQYRHEGRQAELFGGYSPGLAGRITQRYTAGLNYQGDTYEADPAAPVPAAIPADRTLAGPFLRYELIEDEFLQVRNRDLIQRPEYLEMGFHSTLQLGRALGAFGSTDQLWQVDATVSNGWRGGAGRQLLASASHIAQYGGAGDVRSLGASARYFVPQNGNTLLYLAAALDVVKSPNAADELLLGGDNGLRGYPLRYQRGTHRALFTAEERYYTDWYPLRLFRVGAAAYVDVGRAWGGQSPNASSRWLADVGIGLRVLNARASFGNVLHVDLAFPVLKEDPGIKSVQFLVMTAKTF